MGLFGGKRLRDPVEGTFTITGTTVLSADDRGERQVRLTGVLTGTGVAATGTHVHRTFLVSDIVPAHGDTLPAMVDRSNPKHFRITWPARESAAMKARREQAHAERVAAALRLGLDPSVVPADTGPPLTVRQQAEQALDERLARGPLPDGNRQVTADEAARLYVDGISATGTITGIDFLSVPRNALPEPDASLANVAITVTREDGTTYQTTARFGFRTAQRKARFGVVGARIPIRIDPTEPRRVCADWPAVRSEGG
jgi:hypothetical protein